MKVNVLKLIQACAVVALISGCASSPFDHSNGSLVTAEQLAMLKPGVTKQEDALKLLGYPSRKDTYGDNEVWHFDYSRIGAFGPSENTSTVLEWDKQGVLKSIAKGKAPSSGNALLDAANGLN
jgi:outer membrane protein assembly factor BamE (lipoprotein component of BamABCDE complex)